MGYLEEICKNHSQFTLAHALMSPRLGIRKATAEKQADGVYKITVVVSNGGFLPTYTSKRAQSRKVVTGRGAFATSGGAADGLICTSVMDRSLAKSTGS